MIEISWRMGPKRRGRWNVPLSLRVNWVEEGEKWGELNPRMSFKKEYPLPGPISLGIGVEHPKKKVCKEVNKISFSIIDHITPNVPLLTRRVLGVRCSSWSCEECSSRRSGLCSAGVCQAVLPWRPGQPDYSDFEEVFRQLAEDLTAAWKAALEEAMASPAWEWDEVVIAGGEPVVLPQEIVQKKGVMRKLKV